MNPITRNAYKAYKNNIFATLFKNVLSRDLVVRGATPIPTTGHGVCWVIPILPIPWIKLEKTIGIIHIRLKGRS